MIFFKKHFMLAVLAGLVSPTAMASQGDQLWCSEFIVNELAENGFEIRNFPAVGGTGKRDISKCCGWEISQQQSRDVLHGVS